MCGIAGIIGHEANDFKLNKMLDSQLHRGPDSTGKWIQESVALGHNRLSIIDLTDSSNQPFVSADGRYIMVFNGEIYNYIEIRENLKKDFNFKTSGDTEVLLNGFIKYGKDILNQLIGMFSIFIWDNQEKKGFGARDRLGVKPFYYVRNFNENKLIFSSEIKALHSFGVPRVDNEQIWSQYLGFGRYDHSNETFFKDILCLPGGHYFEFDYSNFEIKKYYDLFEITGNEYDKRKIEEVREEYFSLLQDSIQLRFRADVPVGINISGGLDSSALLALVNNVQGDDSNVKAYTFYTGDSNYDELPWVKEMISKTHHPLEECLLTAEMVPELARKMQDVQDEPFGGMPTLAYSTIFKKARNQGTIVLLDGQGMDEQWAGYDYYRKVGQNINTSVIQGSNSLPVQSNTLNKDFIKLANHPNYLSPYNDELRNLQFRDAFYTKIPRALRFNDRVSMLNSTELREPFLDHRLFELSFKQRPEFKIQGEQGKYFMRELLSKMLPDKVVEAPKRPLQTPQREWLKNELKDWANHHILRATDLKPNWLNKVEVLKSWNDFLNHKSDNSFYIWQWITISLMNK